MKRPRKAKLLTKSLLERFELWHLPAGFVYEVRWSKTSEIAYGSSSKHDCERIMKDLERKLFPDLAQLKLYDMGAIKFRKKTLIKLICNGYKDNFERIKKLKQYGVIK